MVTLSLPQGHADNFHSAESSASKLRSSRCQGGSMIAFLLKAALSSSSSWWGRCAADALCHTLCLAVPSLILTPKLMIGLLLPCSRALCIQATPLQKHKSLHLPCLAFAESMHYSCTIAFLQSKGDHGPATHGLFISPWSFLTFAVYLCAPEMSLHPHGFRATPQAHIWSVCPIYINLCCYCTDG